MSEVTRAEKLQRSIAGTASAEKQRIIKEHGLTPAEVARAATMTPGDPVSDYNGRLDIQAEMLVAEREDNQGCGLLQGLKFRAQQVGVLACKVPINI